MVRLCANPACCKVLPDDNLLDTCSFECFEKIYCKEPEIPQFEPILLEGVYELLHM